MISLLYAAILGLVLYVIVYRPLRSSSPLTRVCASVGLMLAFQALAVLNFGTEAVTTAPILPSLARWIWPASPSPSIASTSPAS